MTKRAVIFILGSGRSGTSALARLLSLCGCALPQSLVGAGVANPKGFWEPVDATRLNVEFMSRHDILDDPTMSALEEKVDESDKESFIGKIQAFLDGCPRAPALVIKEFRINELTALWVEAARRSKLSPKIVVAIRHPQQVFASKSDFVARAGGGSAIAPSLSAETFNAFWLKANLLAERNSRDLPRVFVDYSNLMKDWRVEAHRMAKHLYVDLSMHESAVDEFLTPQLHRHKASAPIVETFGYPWISRVYDNLSAAAKDRPLDITSMDEIYSAYRSCARTFTIVLRESKRMSDMKLLDQHIDSLPIWKSGQDF